MRIRKENSKCFVIVTDGLTGHFVQHDITGLSLGTIEAILEDLCETAIRNKEDFRVSFGYEPQGL